MSWWQRAFWVTLWEDKKALLIVVLIVLVVLVSLYTWFQIKRSWNWNVGGYSARAEAMVESKFCEMGKNGAFREGYEWKEHCK